MRGEGCSLTHEEWEFMSKEIFYFSPELTSFLLDPISGGKAKEVPPDMEPELVGFLDWMVTNSPLSGNIRVCNKLLPLLKNTDEKVNTLLTSNAKSLHDRIEEKTAEVYQKMLFECNIKELIQHIQHIDQTKTVKLKENKQSTLTGVPVWYLDADSLVKQTVLVQLLLTSTELTNWEALPQIMPGDDKSTVATDAQQHVVSFLRGTFFAEFKPTYDDLLAKGYIKVAHALKKTFHSKLSFVFGSDNVLFAPIKELQRCKAKLNEYKKEGASPPYAACVCDYLRATVLCHTLSDMVTVLEKLTEHFQVVRIKQRIGPDDKGNKVILLNLIVEDKDIRPLKYAWSGWWDNQNVRMIAEVQIAVKTLFYLDKQAHHSYEIARATNFAEVEYQQGYDGVESEMFPMSPMHTNPLCLL